MTEDGLLSMYYSRQQKVYILNTRPLLIKHPQTVHLHTKHQPQLLSFSTSPFLSPILMYLMLTLVQQKPTSQREQSSINSSPSKQHSKVQTYA